jgi:hypothetical protein
MSEFMANPQLCRNFGGLQGQVAVSFQPSAKKRRKCNDSLKADGWSLKAT